MKFFVFAFIFLVGIGSVTFAQAAEQDKSTARLESILRDLKTIEQQEKSILNSQDATVEEIKNLKVWARKR